MGANESRRREGESGGAWLERLLGVNTAGLTNHQRYRRARDIQAAQDLKREEARGGFVAKPGDPGPAKENRP